MSRGGGTLFVVLIATFAIFIASMVAFRLFLSLFVPSGQDASNAGPIETAITAFLQTFDPGFIAGDLPSSQWYIGSAILAGIGGIFLVALLTALLVTALERRFAELRKGRSQVIEEGHTLILGWDEERVVEIIDQLSIANENMRSDDPREPSDVVVVLAEQDKDYMDDHIREHCSKRKKTRVVTRTGHQWSTSDLGMVSLATARSVIVLSECSYAASDEKKEQADARVIKTLLAVESCRASDEMDGLQVINDGLSVVAELFNGKSRTAASLIGLPNVAALDVKSVLAGILLHTSRSVGLSVVYDELLSFRDAELYLRPVDDIYDGTDIEFRDAATALEHGVAVGIARREPKPDGGHIEFNPPPSTVLSVGDSLMVVARDDSRIKFRADSTWDMYQDGSMQDPEARPTEKQLIIGWGPKTTRLLEQYAEFVAAGSTVHIMKRRKSNPDHADEKWVQLVDKFPVQILDDDPTEPDTWEKIDPLDYQHIIILSDGDRGVPADVVDATTITILLLLRAAIERSSSGEKLNGDDRRTTVVTELVESDNQVIAPNLGLHDFVISSRVVSMLLAELSEDPRLRDVFMALFRAQGCEIYIKPWSRYELPPIKEVDGEVRFRDIMTAAAARNEICIGVKIKADEDNEDANYGVKLVPELDDECELSEEDALVVIAEHETAEVRAGVSTPVDR